MDSVVSTRPGLAELEAEFAEAPLKVRKALQLWKTDDYPQFLAGAAAYLKGADDSAFAKLLLGTLREDGKSLQDILLKEKPLEADEALRVLGLAAKADPSYPVALLGVLRAEGERHSGQYTPGELIRLLDLLQRVVDMNALLPVLAPLCEHPNKQLRSKAVLLAAGHGRKAHMKVDGLGDMDHRVRANAVEALWGEKDAEAISIFLGALNDSHHRVVGNALYGLHRAGNPIALHRIPAMLRQSDANRQMAAAWVMGKTADPRFLGCIETMLPVSTGRTRSNLLHAARSIDDRKKRLQAMPPLDLKLVAAERGEKGRVYCTFVARANGERLLAEDLHATEMVVEDGGMRVDSIRLEARGSAQAGHTVLLLPARLGVDDPYAVKLIEACEEALRGKRTHDQWAILKYEVAWEAPEEGSLSAAVPVDFLSNVEALRAGPLRATKMAARSLQAAIEQAFLSFPEEAKNRSVIVVRDKSLPAMPKLEGRWRETALATGAHLYALLGPGAEAEEADQWRKVARESDGLVIQGQHDNDLPPQLRALCEASAGSFYLTYSLARLGPSGVLVSQLPVRMEVFSEKGYGSLRILEE